jgi:lipopolysaccharide cholinephosphotransferase
MIGAEILIMEESNTIQMVQKAELEMLIEMNRICKENGLTYYLAYGTLLGAVRHKGFIPWDSDVDIMVEADKYTEFCNVIKNNISDKYFLYSIETNHNYEELFARIGLKNNLHQTIHIDIFPLAGAPKKNIAKKLFSKIAYLNYRSFFVKKVDVNVNYKSRPKKRIQAILVKLILFLVPSNLFVWVFKKLCTAYPIKDSDTVCSICCSGGYKELFPKDYLSEPVYMNFEGHKFLVPREWDKYLTRMYGDYMTPRKTN